MKHAREYFAQDATPSKALQFWRDAHTEDQLAEKIRAHLIAERERESLSLMGEKRQYWFNGLTQVEGGPLAIAEYQP